jgi:hypothetical protein
VLSPQGRQGADRAFAQTKLKIAPITEQEINRFLPTPESFFQAPERYGKMSNLTIRLVMPPAMLCIDAGEKLHAGILNPPQALWSNARMHRSWSDMVENLLGWKLAGSRSRRR